MKEIIRRKIKELKAGNLLEKDFLRFLENLPFSNDDVPYLALANSEGLGNNHWQNVIGVDPQMVKFPYRPHPLFQRQRKWRETRSRNEAAAERPPQSKEQGQAGDHLSKEAASEKTPENQVQDHEADHSPQD